MKEELGWTLNHLAGKEGEQVPGGEQQAQWLGGRVRLEWV